ncbi:MAG: GMC family oxidoreductase [Hyphomicrobiaceae bacterium]
MTPDYIIVGGGSAGCVLAERLSRSGRHQVTLLEAGGSDKRFWVQVPLGYGRIFHDEAVNWRYTTEPDPGLDGRSDYWPRGKVLGGSSSINAMVYIRGQSGDYDDWAALGNDGWSWRDVEPVFDSLEGRGNAPGERQGSNAPRLHISDVSARAHPLSRRLIEAAPDVGLSLNPDFNGTSQEGIGYYRLTTTPDSWRMSASRAFLWPARNRANLRVETGAHAQRIVFEGRRVAGVEYLQGGALKRLDAGRELIVSAGAIGSPQLLQLSGIGDEGQLRGLGIGMVHDNPNVGAHLQDHLGVDYVYRARIPTLNDELGTWPRRIFAGMRYLLTGQGPLGLSVNQTGGFFRTPGSPRPNMQLYLQVLTTTTATGARPLLMPDPFAAFSLGISSTRPKSRGTVTLRTSDPHDAPAIQPNSYIDEADMLEMIEGMKFLQKLAETPAIRDVIEAPVGPGTDCVTDDEFRADIRARSGTVFHPCCTCRMAPAPGDGVVGSRLKVHGLDRLRIVDASVFPTITSGNINAPSMMVGAKGAELILADAGVA